MTGTLPETDQPLRAPKGARFAIVAARFNDAIVDRLFDGASAELRERGVAADDLVTVRVPGAFELPLACKHVAERSGVKAVIALGCVIRGGTPHFEYVCSAAAQGCQQAALETGVPIAFGVLTTDNLAQAEERAGPDDSNKGREAARAALEMVAVLAAQGQ
jgi:6,7-dimethyl-8-ribityllumazine synthase